MTSLSPTRALLLSLLVAVGCTDPESETGGELAEGDEVVVPGPRPTREAASTESEAVAEAPEDALLRAEPIEVGGERKAVWLDHEGVLHVGPLTATIEDFAAPEDHGETAWRQASLAVVTFDAEREVIVLALPIAEQEDPPSHYRVFLVEGDRLRPIFDEVVGAYGIHPILLPGDGTVRYVEDGWTACGRLGHPAGAIRQEVVHRFDPDTGTLTEERTDTDAVQRCDQLAACPFVYLVDGEEERFVGEVLRDVRGRGSATLQPLAIGAIEAGTTHIRVREEKEEVTFLDELYVDVDGVRFEAPACEGGAAFCAADGESRVLRPGDTLDLVMELPAGELTIWARGYYVPTPTAASR